MEYHPTAERIYDTYSEATLLIVSDLKDMANIKILSILQALPVVARSVIIGGFAGLLAVIRTWDSFLPSHPSVTKQSRQAMTLPATTVVNTSDRFESPPSVNPDTEPFSVFLTNNFHRIMTRCHSLSEVRQSIDRI